MYSKKKILAIIPARGGSKGLPGKNIKLLNEKPLIGWTIEQAKASEYIDQIFVSTDSPEIADVARKFGVSIPFLRPDELATDTSPSSAFVLHTLEYYQNKGDFFDYIILLEPTSPLRDVADIDNAIEMLLADETAESIVAVSAVEDKHPSFLTKLNGGFLKPYLDTFGVIRRQELEQLFFFCGSLYISSIPAYIERKSFYHERCLPYIMPKHKSVEIDDITDFRIVETLMKLKINKEFE